MNVCLFFLVFECGFLYFYQFIYRSTNEYLIQFENTVLNDVLHESR